MDVNWQAVGAIGEVFGALFIFASLVYLATQIRQSSKVVRSQNIHAETEQFQRTMEMQANPALLNAIVKQGRNEDLSYEEANQVECLLMSSLAASADVFKHHQEGLEVSGSWSVARRRIESMFLSNWSKAWWKEAGRYVFERDFVAEVDDVISGIRGHADPVKRSFDRLTREE